MQLSTTWGLDDLWTQSQFVGVGLGLQKESIPPILPQLKVELHDDQTFLMKKPFSTLYLLSSFFYIFFFFLLSSIFNLSSTSFFSSFVKTETKCLLHLNHHLGVFHHALKWIPTHLLAQSSSNLLISPCCTIFWLDFRIVQIPVHHVVQFWLKKRFQFNPVWYLYIDRDSLSY